MPKIGPNAWHLSSKPSASLALTMASYKNLSRSPSQTYAGSKDRWPSGHRREVRYTKNTKTRAIKSKRGWDSYGDALSIVWLFRRNIRAHFWRLSAKRRKKK